MNILDHLGLGASVARAAPRSSSALRDDDLSPRRKTGGHAPVGYSADLGRILAVPRRSLASAWAPSDVAALEDRLRAPPGTACVCEAQGRPHCDRLLPVQAHALLEAESAGGLMGGIGVGHGKTLIDLLLAMVVPGVKTAVLLIPANLRAQLLERDWPYYGGHWQLPNLASGRWFAAGKPSLHVCTYNKLSNQDSTDLLKRIAPDLVICDEAHNLKARSATRTGRFLRYMRAAGRPVKLAAQSGTLFTRSIKDSAHLCELALGDATPLPRHPPTVDEWASALDPSELASPPGALERFVEGGEDVRDAIRRRLADTRGVVLTEAGSLGTSLIIRKRDPGTVPPDLLAFIELAHHGERPDGEQFTEKLQEVACARQLSAGFFHRWRYPRGEPPKVIERWFAERQSWNREVRDRLKRPREHMDSPGLLENAAVRAHQDPRYEGALPVWPAASWPAWCEVRDTVEPETQAVWKSDFLIADAAEWAGDAKNPGIVWVEFPELGERIARAAGVAFFGGGPRASEEIIREDGKRSIVASIKAHGTGKNMAAFRRNLVVNPPADGAAWEQLIGRTHRQGQLADEVEVEVYQHTADYREAFAKAREYARFQQQLTGNRQKLLYADFEGFDS